MSLLVRKLLRDLSRLKGQSTAIAMLVALAIAVFVGAITTHQSLSESRERYYASYHFADVFDSLSAAPAGVAERLVRVPGIARSETRLTANATLHVQGFDESVTARVYSLPEGRQPTLGKLFVRLGRLPSSGAAFEVVIGESFAKAQSLAPGQSLTAVIEGKSYRLQIVGVALSPEFIYQVRPGALMPDDKRFTVLWVGDELLGSSLGLRHAFNDVTIQLRPGASEPQVIAEVDRILEPYGGAGAYGREQHVSHRFLSDELTQLRSTAVVVPGIFLAVAVFLLNVILHRLIALQREQIATLKALGFGKLSIAAHYSSFAVIMVLVGCATGAGIGWLLGKGMTTMYAGYYRIPVFRYHYDGFVLAQGTGLALGASLVGTLGSIRRVLKLQPAEAMRPPRPARFHRGWWETLGWGRVLGTVTRMTLRNVLNSPIRSLLSAVGVGSAVAILVLGLFFRNAMDHVMNLQFRDAQREDVTITLTDPLRRDLVTSELRRMPGVTHVEAQRDLPVRYTFEGYSHRSGITGIDRGARLRRVLNAQEHAVALPKSGILMSTSLADVLHIKAGQVVTMHVLEGTRGVYRARVSQLIEDAFGANAYASLAWLNTLVDGAPRANSLQLLVRSTERASLFRRLGGLPKIQAVTQRLDTLHAFEQVSAEMIVFFSGVLTLFGAAIAAGVVYNVARIALAERERDLGTLRVIGFTRREVSKVLLGEIGIIVAAALPIGCGLGWLLAQGTAESMQTDLYRIPAIIYPSTYVYSIAVVLASSAVVAWAVQRRVYRLDLMGVLKTRE